MVISLIIVTECSPISSADESLPQPMEDGSTYSSIRDPRRILRYIPIRPHQHRLAAYYLSHREMEARDPHIPCPCCCVSLSYNFIFCKIKFSLEYL